MCHLLLLNSFFRKIRRLEKHLLIVSKPSLKKKKQLGENGGHNNWREENALVTMSRTRLNQDQKRHDLLFLLLLPSSYGHMDSCLSPEDQRGEGYKGFGTWEVLMNKKARKGSSDVPQDKIKKQQG